MSVRIVMKKSVNSFFESEVNAKCDEQKTDSFCPGYLYLHVVEPKTTGTCIVVAVIELYMYTYLFNFSGEDSVKDFD